MGTRWRHVRVCASNREQTEDAAEVFERGDALVVALADGVGGIHGGATASRALVAAVSSASNAARLTDLRHWAHVLLETDAALAKSGAGQTTGVIVALDKTGLVGVSVGDSQAWIVEPKQLDDLTKGQDTKRRLGSGQALPTAFERSTLTGVLLLASDGLFRFAAPDVIARVVRDSPIGVAAEQLIELVRLPSGKFGDDVTAVLVGGVDANGRSS